MKKERLQKILAKAGIASRRKAEEMIANGLVQVNGKTVQKIPLLVDTEKDVITVDGRTVCLEKKLYYMFHKPEGVITSLSDPQKRQTVADFFIHIKERLYPVGRLDYRSEGLLLITNDGDWANHILHPSNSIPKTYRVKVKGKPSREKMSKLTKGVYLEDGKVKAESVLLEKFTKENAWIKVNIIEGRKHVVRRMFKSIGHPVTRLIRIKIGPFVLKGLEKGEIKKIDNPDIIYSKKSTERK